MTGGTVRRVQVTLDCADPNALAGFWVEALGYADAAPLTTASTPDTSS